MRSIIGQGLDSFEDARHKWMSASGIGGASRRGAVRRHQREEVDGLRVHQPAASFWKKLTKTIPRGRVLNMLAGCSCMQKSLTTARTCLLITLVVVVRRPDGGVCARGPQSGHSRPERHGLSCAAGCAVLPSSLLVNFSASSGSTETAVLVCRSLPRK